VTEVLSAGGWLRGAVFFVGFFVGTSVWLVPVAFMTLAWLNASREGLSRLARASAVVVGAAFALQTVALLRPAASGGSGAEELADALRSMYPRAGAVRYYDVPERFEVSLAPGKSAPDVFVAVASAEGFGGPVRVLTALDRRGVIQAVRLLPSRETPSYLRRVDSPAVLSRFTGRSYADEFSIHDLDAVSRATMTAWAVEEAVRKGARRIAVETIGLPPPPRATSGPARGRSPVGAADVAAVLYVCAVAAWFRRPRPAWHASLAAAASVAVLGLLAGRFISVADVSRVLAGAWPSWRVAGGAGGTGGWYVFVGAVAALTFVRGRAYCRHMCPFGALSLLLNRVKTPKLVPAGGVFRALRSVRWVLLGVTALGYAYTAETALFAYEPFGPTFEFISASLGASGGGGRLADLIAFQPVALGLAAFVLVVSLFVPRFWCRFLCPAGAAMEVIAGAWPGRDSAAGAGGAPGAARAELSPTDDYGTAGQADGTSREEVLHG